MQLYIVLLNVMPLCMNKGNGISLEEKIDDTKLVAVHDVWDFFLAIYRQQLCLYM